MRIAVLHTNANYLVGLRLPFMRRLISLGHEVVAIAPNMDSEHISALYLDGVIGLRCDLDATGFNPLVDIANSIKLVTLFKKQRPDLLLSNTAKAVIYGSLAAKLAGVSRRFALVSGLGYAFTDDGAERNYRKAFTKAVMSFLYGISLRLNEGVIFQNRDDLEELCSAGICARGRSRVVAGSGVDTIAFAFKERELNEPVYLFVGRLLVEKGVREYLAAARVVKQRIPSARFILVGNRDGNPSAIHASEIDSYVLDGTIEHVGSVSDVRPYLYESNIFVLPSYREGVPRSTLEAMSTGLAVITTDVPGCRETVREGVNGFLVNARDVESLAATMIRLGLDPSLISQMGKFSRDIAEARFDVDLVNDEMCRLMGVGSSVVAGSC